MGNATGNIGNGHSAKALAGEFGEVEIAFPCDREAKFRPQLIPKLSGDRPYFVQPLTLPHSWLDCIALTGELRFNACHGLLPGTRSQADLRSPESFRNVRVSNQV